MRRLRVRLLSPAPFFVFPLLTPPRSRGKMAALSRETAAAQRQTRKPPIRRNTFARCFERMCVLRSAATPPEAPCRAHLLALLCNGSTRVFGTWRRGSNPREATIFRRPFRIHETFHRQLQPRTREKDRRLPRPVPRTRRCHHLGTTPGSRRHHPRRFREYVKPRTIISCA